MNKILFLSIVILLNISCSKCPTRCLGVINFTEEELKMIPYAGNETLIFIDSVNDSLRFNGINKLSDHSNFYHISDDNYPCESDYYYVEEYRTYFAQENKNGEIVLVAIKNPQNTYNSFQIDFKYDRNDTFERYSVSYAFNNYDFVTYSYDSNGYIIKCPYDSITLGNNTYFNVYDFNAFNETTHNYGILYLTVADGIVGLETDKGHLWYVK